MASSARTRISAAVFSLLILFPILASAHQPRVVESRQTFVNDPEVSKAYYGRLAGAPDVFTIEASAPFNLYINILVPDIAGQKKDVSAAVTKDGQPFASLDGAAFDWKQMFEPFGYDHYWAGPEYKAVVQAGTYVISVSSAENDSKYSLAIGEIEKFDFKETMNALTLVPQLKSTFFNESPIGFIGSPFGWGLIAVLYILAAIIGFIYRFIMRRAAKKSARRAAKNIGTGDRAIRLLIGAALLLLAITTTWNPFLIFLSGFSIFEGIFSWCGVYAALGKNSCPLE